MAEVSGLYDFPLTGARARSCEQAALSAGGFITDRIFVLYDGDNNRIGQKQAPQLARLSADIMEDWLVLNEDDETSELLIPFANDEESAHTTINEFGDQLPVIDMGDFWAKHFAKFTGIQSARLAQKNLSWQLGYGRTPKLRRQAPLHIVTNQSVERIKEMTGVDSVGAERFRPNIVIDLPEQEPFAENHWRSVRIGKHVLHVARLTKRCPVPGFDQLTGENKKDVPKAYRYLEKAEDDKKPIFGVYAYPEVKAGKIIVLSRHDEVRAVD